MSGSDQGCGTFAFGSFRLDPVGRTLQQDGTRLHLSARLFDTLLYLVENHDRLVTREELHQAVWSTHTVADDSLGRAISSLRLALRNAGGDGLIITAPGRGYRFGTRVRQEFEDNPQASPDPPLPMVPPRRMARWPILACAALAVSGLAAFSLTPRPDPAGTTFAPPPRSIAVLPFVNRGADAADTIYADGIAQELINALGRIDDMKVAASTSSFLFRDRRTTIGDIARQLNVGAVLEGSVQRANAHVHVTVELIDAQSGFQLWSRVFDENPENAQAMQSEIAAAAVTHLKGVILGDEITQLTLGGTANPAAFDAYLKGVAELRALDANANRRAVAAFNQAVAIDPQFALAFARRARALAFIGTFGDSPDVDYSHRVMAAALADARHAVSLAPDLGSAHADLAFALQTGLVDLREAEAEYRRAVALAPGDAATLLDYARFQLQMGQTAEAIAVAQRAVALDPLAARTHARYAIILEYARRYADARQTLHRAMVLDQGRKDYERITLGMLETLEGHAAAAQRVCAGDVDYRDMMCLAIADHMLGRQADAAAELAKAQAVLGGNGAFLYARVLAHWGQTDAALGWLRTAYDHRDPGLIELKIDPAFDHLRDTAQYGALIRRMSFPAL